MRHEPPKLALTRTLTSAITYQFHVEGRDFGWALCTMNDTTGELAIISDWGNWSHIWNPRHLGSPSLHDFIGVRTHGGNGAFDYLAMKLLGRSAAWRFEAEATVTKWRKRLCEARLEHGRRMRDYRYSYMPPLGNPVLDAGLARELWDALGEIDADFSESLFIERAMQLDGIGWISERPWEETEHVLSYDYRILTESILPALAEACIGTVSTRAICEAIRSLVGPSAAKAA